MYTLSKKMYTIHGHFLKIQTKMSVAKRYRRKNWSIGPIFSVRVSCSFSTHSSFRDGGGFSYLMDDDISSYVVRIIYLLRQLFTLNFFRLKNMFTERVSSVCFSFCRWIADGRLYNSFPTRMDRCENTCFSQRVSFAQIYHGITFLQR